MPQTTKLQVKRKLSAPQVTSCKHFPFKSAQMEGSGWAWVTSCSSSGSVKHCQKSQATVLCTNSMPWFWSLTSLQGSPEPPNPPGVKWKGQARCCHMPSYCGRRSERCRQRVRQGTLVSLDNGLHPPDLNHCSGSTRACAYLFGPTNSRQPAAGKAVKGLVPATEAPDLSWKGPN